ncbi:prepilin-type N-terminal cleavage/methylation domain-containing protein [Pseudomonas citronellolis]|jgi:general secretion pathway protein J|uniref:Prepilin-type N-terminal cleavage/methylation domain-containing protein n=1 Tax=Pseudomonas citronellolis TaxID=53408 RepID=A0AAW6P705_9PSED|nr:prepilin-type N-terminal cleavage/methylation domain-containing protein [Pseudomonas citronellolis]MDF3842111.1 prepilin-type N-terminal cleavage/methylation domain-containing protein [Pseudomonas citronellolis]
MSRRISRGRERGFTLLELIVVLLLAAMVTTLLMQGMDYVSRANDSFLRQGESRQLRVLAFGWFDDAIAQLAAPARGDAPARFRGDPLSFEAVSLASAERIEGVPVPFAFRLERLGEPGRERTAMIYVRRLQASRWPLLELQGAAHFLYRDEQGAWHDNWPPLPVLADSLPAAVALNAPEERLFRLARVATPLRRVNADAD